ncbi:MAG: type II secretion system protein M [Candidatus Thiothrix singaporensis]|uniref:Type II secretion system protein M n=1 Tax=Candidatus Thiothrix singaporensis TaxID=2799669 RepID=A0A7L6AW14_9GAMM|nr:MAG: type II secretion system protein M [Candidatus Thiothrix singaporensis]
MKTWWNSLAPRERQLVMAGAILIGLTLVWLFVWRPLASHHQLLQQDLADARPPTWKCNPGAPKSSTCGAHPQQRRQLPAAACTPP